MRRYLLPGILVALPVVEYGLWSLESQALQSCGFLVCLAAWPIGSIWWVILAIRDRRPYLARLLLVWVPAIIPISVLGLTMMAFAKDDSVGIVLAPMLWVILAICAAFVLASIIASLRTLDEAPSES